MTGAAIDPLAELRAALRRKEANSKRHVLKRAPDEPTGETKNGAAVVETCPKELSDDALALRFADRHAAELRYVAAWGRWMRWNGTKWQQDDTLAIYDLARKVCRDATTPTLKPSVATAVASASTTAAVERMARSDRRVAAAADQWDADPWLLNTPDGLVDLRTAKVAPSRPETYCTKSTAVAPGGDCPTWKAFLERVTGNDVELIAFLQRMAGYALTGITREHALFFLYGLGGNGKSVFIDTLSGIMADYATTAAIETFIATNFNSHPTDVASLRGARLVTAVETEEGRRWAESKIKTMTGGDKIAARFMRQDYFVFTPQFKLVIAGNHKPGIRNIDEAMRRRLHLVPFEVTIPKDERDATLKDRLRTEWPGILQWMIDGAVAWSQHKLQAPERVRAATEEYLASEDSISTWMAECCQVAPGERDTSARLFASWKAWAERAGEFAMNQKRFVQVLRDRGFESYRTSATRGFVGLSVIWSAMGEAPWTD